MKYVLSFAFLLTIWLVPVVGLFTVQQVSTAENRTLAVWPTSFDLKAIDAYLNDHFGGRDAFIFLYHAWTDLFGKDTTPKVVQGQGNWLFYVDSVSLYQGKQSWEDTDAMIAEIADFVKAVAPVPVVAAVIPNKTFVYPSKLPNWINISNQRNEIINKLNDMDALYVVDTLPALAQATVSQDTYMAGDTHWNGYGAYVAYQSIIAGINQQLGWQLKVKDDIAEVQANDTFLGGLARMNGAGKGTDTEKTLVFAINHAQKVEKAFDLSAFKTPDYQNPQGQYKVFTLHDSFMDHHLGRYLAESFAEMNNAWMHSFSQAVPAIQQSQPDMVLIEIVDRHIQR